MALHSKLIGVAFLFGALTHTHAQVLWQRASYDMSVTEVQSIQPDARPPTENPKTLVDGSRELLRTTTQIVEKPFNVEFFFKGGRLKQVSLSLLRTTKTEVEDAFLALLPLLRAKYGRESLQDQHQNGKLMHRAAKWTGDGVQVSLNLWSFTDLSANLYIAYRGISRQGAEKL